MPDNMFVISIIGFFFGIISFFHGFTCFKQKRLIENTPTSKIRSMAMGLVEVYGEVIPAKDKILKSPLTNTDCVYYKYTVEERRQSGKSSRWVIIRSGEDEALFYLKDNTGLVLVDLIGASIDIPKNFEYDSGLFKDPPLPVRQFLKKNNLSFEGFLGINKTMRFREFYIAPKEKLYIMGTAGDNPYMEEGTEKEDMPDIMIAKGKNEKIFYVSDKPEKEILKSLTWKSFLGIFGGGILTIVCLAVILFQFGMLF